MIGDVVGFDDDRAAGHRARRAVDGEEPHLVAGRVEPTGELVDDGLDAAVAGRWDGCPRRRQQADAQASVDESSWRQMSWGRRFLGGRGGTSEYPDRTDQPHPWGGSCGRLPPAAPAMSPLAARRTLRLGPRSSAGQSSGLLIRRSHVRIVPGALAGCAQQITLGSSTACPRPPPSCQLQPAEFEPARGLSAFVAATLLAGVARELTLPSSLMSPPRSATSMPSWPPWPVAWAGSWRRARSPAPPTSSLPPRWRAWPCSVVYDPNLGALRLVVTLAGVSSTCARAGSSWPADHGKRVRAGGVGLHQLLRARHRRGRRGGLVMAAAKAWCSRCCATTAPRSRPCRAGVLVATSSIGAALELLELAVADLPPKLRAKGRCLAIHVEADLLRRGDVALFEILERDRYVRDCKRMPAPSLVTPRPRP